MPIRHFQFILLGFALCCLAGKLIAAERHILVLGDSLSAGYGIAQNAGWVHLLQQRLQQQYPDIAVINASISGDTTHGGLTRLPAALQRHHPAIVVIQLGGNDGLRGLDLAQAQNNLGDMIELARQAGAQVLLLGVKLPANYGPVYAAQFHQIYTNLAKEKQVALVDFFLQGVAETTALMQADGIHPSAKAQPRILQNVWPKLEKLLQWKVLKIPHRASPHAAYSRSNGFSGRHNKP